MSWKCIYIHLYIYVYMCAWAWVYIYVWRHTNILYIFIQNANQPIRYISWSLLGKAWLGLLAVETGSFSFFNYEMRQLVLLHLGLFGARALYRIWLHCRRHRNVLLLLFCKYFAQSPISRFPLQLYRLLVGMFPVKHFLQLISITLLFSFVFQLCF